MDWRSNVQIPLAVTPSHLLVTTNVEIMKMYCESQRLKTTDVTTAQHLKEND